MASRHPGGGGVYVRLRLGQQIIGGEVREARAQPVQSSPSSAPIIKREAGGCSRSRSGHRSSICALPLPVRQSAIVSSKYLSFKPSFVAGACVWTLMGGWWYRLRGTHYFRRTTVQSVLKQRWPCLPGGSLRVRFHSFSRSTQPLGRETCCSGSQNIFACQIVPHSERVRDRGSIIERWSEIVVHRLNRYCSEHDSLPLACCSSGLDVYQWNVIRLRALLDQSNSWSRFDWGSSSVINVDVWYCFVGFERRLQAHQSLLTTDAYVCGRSSTFATNWCSLSVLEAVLAIARFIPRAHTSIFDPGSVPVQSDSICGINVLFRQQIRIFGAELSGEGRWQASTTSSSRVSVAVRRRCTTALAATPKLRQVGWRQARSSISEEERPGACQPRSWKLAARNSETQCRSWPDSIAPPPVQSNPSHALVCRGQPAKTTRITTTRVTAWTTRRTPKWHLKARVHRHRAFFRSPRRSSRMQNFSTTSCAATWSPPVPTANTRMRRYPACEGLASRRLQACHLIWEQHTWIGRQLGLPLGCSGLQVDEAPCRRSGTRAVWVSSWAPWPSCKIPAWRLTLT